MTDPERSHTGLRVVARLVQTVAGLFAGVVVVWILWQVLPFRSATGVLVGSLVVTLSFAIVLAVCAQRFRLGAIAFGVSSTVLNVLVAVMVV